MLFRKNIILHFKPLLVLYSDFVTTEPFFSCFFIFFFGIHQSSFLINLPTLQNNKQVYSHQNVRDTPIFEKHV